MICSLHWNGDKLATGGDDGIVRLWNPSAFVDPPSKAAKKKGKKGVKFDVERGAGEVTEVSRPDGLFHECVRSVFIKSDQQRKAIRVLVGTRGGEIFESVVSQGVTDSRVLSSVRARCCRPPYCVRPHARSLSLPACAEPLPGRAVGPSHQPHQQQSLLHLRRRRHSARVGRLQSPRSVPHKRPRRPGCPRAQRGDRATHAGRAGMCHVAGRQARCRGHQRRRSA